MRQLFRAGKAPPARLVPFTGTVHLGMILGMAMSTSANDALVRTLHLVYSSPHAVDARTCGVRLFFPPHIPLPPLSKGLLGCVAGARNTPSA